MNREEAEKHWIDIITDSRTYASGIAAYCRDRNISIKNYYVWFGKLKASHPEWTVEPEKDSGATKEIRPRLIKPRRNFSAAAKSKILDEIDSASHGQIGAILRREGIYSATLQKWRTERAQRSLEPRKRGPKENAEAKEIKRLNAEVARLSRRLEQAEDIIEVQKKNRIDTWEARNRRELIAEVQALSVRLNSVTKACHALGVKRTDYYRWLNPAGKKARSRPRSHRALLPEEKEEILAIMNSPCFVDKAPQAICAILLDEDRYYCSPRTMYRILQENRQVKERRRIARRSEYAKPELLATQPKELWSWDVTKLRGPERNTFYYLFVMIDVYSRFVVGWMISHNETGELAKEFLEQAYERESVEHGSLTIHSDRGSSMTSLSVTTMLDKLCVAQSFSRPQVSDDNPYSESQFKTMKQRPEFPDRFNSIEDARNFCLQCFPWYNYEHRHSGIANMAPHVVHSGQDEICRKRRQDVLTKAFHRHPERFTKGKPIAAAVPKEVWINPPKADIICSIIKLGAQEILAKSRT